MHGGISVVCQQVEVTSRPHFVCVHNIDQANFLAAQDSEFVSMECVYLLSD